MLSVIDCRMLLNKSDHIVLDLTKLLLPDFKFGRIKSWGGNFTSCISVRLIYEVDVFIRYHFLELCIDESVVKSIDYITVEFLAKLILQFLKLTGSL